LSQDGNPQLSFLFQNGYVKIRNLGTATDDLADKANMLFDTVPQNNLNLNTIGIKNPFLLNDTPQQFLYHSLVNSLVQDYLGSDAIFDRMILFRIPECSKNPKVSGLWHHDRVGRRLKLFVFLHHVDEASRPTIYAAGSHIRQLRTNTYRSSRVPEKSISHYELVPLTGKKGDAVLFDTNGIHRASYEASNVSRDVMVFEWGSRAKGQALSRYGLPIGIMKELFPLSLQPEQTLMDTNELQRNAEYFQYGIREPRAQFFHVDALNFR
jgi:ectoine hydroxylase-related dioxygenase (phytanoyl-CoA dioxygenase family)